MKVNYQYIISIVIALGLGFLIAWSLKPSGSSSSVSHEEHAHETSQTSGTVTEYTCSMHPQIRQDEPGICPICEMDLIPADQNSSDDPMVLTMTKEAAKLANIQTMIIGNANVSEGGKEIIMTGKVKANETTASSLVAHVPGRIDKLYVSYKGESVKAGQKLVEIYSPELIGAQQELLQAVNLMEVNPGLVDAAKSKLKTWKLSDQMIQNIMDTKQIQETFTFYAESSGIVSNRRVAVGDYVRQGGPLFDLIDLNKLWIVFDAYEEDLAHIRKGNRISFTTPALGERKFVTNVSFIDPVINPDTRTAAVRTEFNNLGGRLKPEMFVNGVYRQKKMKRESSLLVPKSAVLWTGKRSVVYSKVQDQEIPSYRFQEIEIGERIGDFYEVKSGLEEGTEVVINGAFSIDAAAQLNNQYSMMNKNVLVKKDPRINAMTDFKSEVNSDFNAQISDLLIAYIALKNDLVETDPDAGSESAKGFIEKLSSIDMTIITGDALTFWLEKKNTLFAHGSGIAEADDAVEQRKEFVFLSDEMIKVVKAFGVQNENVYVQHCPMAFDDKGADWLSLDKEIRNPYFGSKMMKCGVITDTFNSVD